MRNSVKRPNKKAISGVVATVITIGAVVAVMAILTPIILDLVKSPMLSPAVSCNEILNSPPIILKDVCYDPSSKEIRVMLGRTFDSIEISSMTFSLNNNNKKRTWECSPNCRNCDIPDSGETKYYYLPIGEELNKAALTLSAGECALERKEVVTQCNE